MLNSHLSFFLLWINWNEAKKNHYSYFLYWKSEEANKQKKNVSVSMDPVMGCFDCQGLRK
jgi:hypothetical protein